MYILLQNHQIVTPCDPLIPAKFRQKKFEQFSLISVTLHGYTGGRSDDLQNPAR